GRSRVLAFINLTMPQAPHHPILNAGLGSRVEEPYRTFTASPLSSICHVESAFSLPRHSSPAAPMHRLPPRCLPLQPRPPRRLPRSPLPALLRAADEAVLSAIRRLRRAEVRLPRVRDRTIASSRLRPRHAAVFSPCTSSTTARILRFRPVSSTRIC